VSELCGTVSHCLVLKDAKFDIFTLPVRPTATSSISVAIILKRRGNHTNANTLSGLDMVRNILEDFGPSREYRADNLSTFKPPLAGQEAGGSPRNLVLYDNSPVLAPTWTNCQG
jgi:hypothetical protein